MADADAAAAGARPTAIAAATAKSPIAERSQRKAGWDEGASVERGELSTPYWLRRCPEKFRLAGHMPEVTAIVPMELGAMSAQPVGDEGGVIGVSGALLIATGCSGSTPSEGVRLLQQASEATYPSVYRYVERPDADGLLACVGGGNRVVAATVDVDRQVATFAGSVDVAPSVVWTSDEIYVRAAHVLDLAPTEWVSIQRQDVDSEAAATVLGRLDESVAEAARAQTLPDSAQELVEAVLSADPETTTSADADGRTVVQASVDAAELDAIDTSEQLTDGLVIDLTIGKEGRVDTIYSTTLRPDGSVDTEAFGLTIEFDWSPSSTAVFEPGPEIVTPLADVDVSAPNDSGLGDCELGA